MEQKYGVILGLVVGSIGLLSLNQVYRGAVIEGLAGNDVLTVGPSNDVLTVGPGADSFNCGPGNDIIKDSNKAKGDNTSKNCEPSEEPIDCNVILNVIKTLRDERSVLQEKLDSARTNQDPDIDDDLDAQIASLNAKIASLNAQIGQQEEQLEECLQMNIDNTAPPEPKGKEDQLQSNR